MQQQCTKMPKKFKNQKFRFKSKKSDLDRKNLIFSIFLVKIMIFSNPGQLLLLLTHGRHVP